MDELKPCPFCGKNDLILHHDISVPSETHGMYSVHCNSCDASTKYCDDPMEACMAWNRRAEETPPTPQWVNVNDELPPEHDTIFAKLYGTDKWRDAMFRKMSDDVRVVKMLRDGTRRVHHDHTVDGVWDCERKDDIYGRVTHWMPNPELPEATT